MWIKVQSTFASDFVVFPVVAVDELVAMIWMAFLSHYIFKLGTPQFHPHSSVQHASSTQGQLLFSPQKPSVPHKCVSFTQIREFNTNAWVPHKCVSSTQMRQFPQITSLQDITSTFLGYRLFVFFWGFFDYGVGATCRTDGFRWLKTIGPFVELTC